VRTQTQLKACAYLLTLLGLWSVTATEHFSAAWPLLATVVVLASWFYEGPRNKQTAYRRVWMTLGVCMLFYFPLDIAYSYNLLLPALHISLFAQAYLLFNPKRIRAYRRIFVVSFAQVLASTNLTTDVVFAVILAAYGVTVVYGIMLMQVLQGFQDPDADLRSDSKTPPQLIALSLILTAMLLPVTLGFFYSAPRMQFALIASGRNIEALRQITRARARSGFTRTIQLGTFGRIQEDQTLALRVEIPEGSGPLRGVRRWRGGALNIYDGTTWSSSRDYFAYYSGKTWRTSNRNTGTVFPKKDGLFVMDERFAYYDTTEELDADPRLEKQIFYLEIPYSETIFAAAEIMAVQGPFKYGIAQDFNRSFAALNREALSDFVSYTVYSEVHERDEAALRRDSHERLRQLLEDESSGDYVRSHYLQAPPSLDPQIRRLALDITKDAATPYDMVIAIEDFLETRYMYSLELGAPVTDDPLAHFLFVSRTGHCEYFATAMTLMTRMVGVPARIVRGFQKGEWNEDGRFYEVRQRDAHAWVEAYFPSFGWVEFDPSPRGVADEYFKKRRSFIARAFAKRFLSLQILWRKHVVGYNEIRRLRLFGKIKNIVLHEAPRLLGGLLGRSAKTAWDLIATHMAVALAAAAVLIAALIGYRKGILLPSMPWPGLRKKRGGTGTAFYERMLNLLEKRKIFKPPHMTSLEFLCHRPLREHPMFPEIEELTSIYYRVRFGGDALASSETAAINDTLKRLKRSNGEVRRRGHAEKPGP